MSSRSPAVCLMLTFMCAGPLGGCGEDSKITGTGKDASPDSRPGEKDAAGVPDAGLSADVEPGKQDTPGEDTSAVPADAAADTVLGRDTALKKDTQSKDAPPSVDSPAAASLDSRPIDTKPASEVGKPADAPPVADSKPGIDSNLTPFCQTILLDNTFMPPTYPVLYREPADAEASYGTRTGALLSAYGLGSDAYTFEPTPIAWTTTIKQGMGPCTLMLGGTVTQDTVAAMAQSFLSKWGDLFQYKDNGKAGKGGATCFNKFCQARLEQDYCGLPVHSSEQSYSGTATFLVYTNDGCLNEAYSTFVPMVPMPRNVLVSEAELKQAIVGLTLSFFCAMGERTVQVSEGDSLTIPDTSAVLVRTSATEANVLEYRLAVPVEVTVGSGLGLPWTIYVDGIDGTVLESVAGFICD